ncbi:hypothetical protein J3F83DRAFT_741664 [Trichoderma novae-zelandiae]
MVPLFFWWLVSWKPLHAVGAWDLYVYSVRGRYGTLMPKTAHGLPCDRALVLPTYDFKRGLDMRLPSLTGKDSVIFAMPDALQHSNARRRGFLC